MQYTTFFNMYLYRHLFIVIVLIFINIYQNIRLYVIVNRSCILQTYEVLKPLVLETLLLHCWVALESCFTILIKNTKVTFCFRGEFILYFHFFVQLLLEQSTYLKKFVLISIGLGFKHIFNKYSFIRDKNQNKIAHAILAINYYDISG